ncbi:MAG TPA: UDP-N-acetylmuramoyl-L-alanyl-D-glutamate--2,6-diaminopimelate ligase [Cyclobacteriaceae bacterium]|nr:UDP-N-acetylmuramoyl-L-alanyl-D-glutamate--2,6-diaminopimelate ligase [Cyclobacteriaceae bacterium]
MRELKDILYRVNITSASGDMNIGVAGVSFDSRQVKKDFLFVAVKGTQSDGHAFISTAIKNGAIAVISEKLPDSLSPNVTYVTVKNSARALGVAAANFYNNPSSKLKLVGVTGTNGKTTVATLLYKLFTSLGHPTGLLSTVENRIKDEVIVSTHTTPDAIQINELLIKMVEAKCTHCFMEVSSHAVDQGRIEGLDFVGGVFTNITHDHLDYHHTFESYIKAKKGFFDGLSSEAFALVNVDDKRGMVMLQNTKAAKRTFGLKKMADFKAKIITNSLEGLELEIDNRNVWFKLIGDFNAYNLISVYATAMLLGEDSESVLMRLSALTGAAGRFELILPGSKFTAIVDYSHTPDALKNVLETISLFRTGQEQVISVVGCGGDRDKMKRPLMAAIACKYSDKAIFTADNPRSEDPMEIIREMQKGVGPTEAKKTLVIVDREEAIKTACMMAKENDIVLVAGKGHETYQEIKGVKYPFDDKEVLTRMLKMFAN